ncbi:hypothetical protein [Salipaludibacillus sp. CF4.18]|uniref:hypothetical protein n=1 Tax=Salipaludibacillus sp. CF4.18 TaxID=3373081 RepID=UPI003EE6FB50
MNSQARLDAFLVAFNDKEDYVQGHNIGRDMLLNGENRKLAKLFASLSGLAEQFSKGKKQGFLKFEKMALKQLEEMPEHPFDEKDLLRQINDLNTLCVSSKNQTVPLKLRVK